MQAYKQGDPRTQLRRNLQQQIRDTQSMLDDLRRAKKQKTDTEWAEEHLQGAPLPLKTLRIAHALSTLPGAAAQSWHMICMEQAFHHSSAFDPELSVQATRQLMHHWLHIYRSSTIHFQPYNDEEDAHSMLGWQMHSWLSEWKTYAWLVSMNAKGVLLTTEHLLACYLQNIAPAAHSPLYHDFLRKNDDNKHHAANWCRKFKMQWDVKFAPLPHVGNDFDVTTIKAKAGQFKTIELSSNSDKGITKRNKNTKPHVFRVLIFASIFGLHFCDLLFNYVSMDTFLRQI